MWFVCVEEGRRLCFWTQHGGGNIDSYLSLGVLEERRRKSEVGWGGGSGSSVCLINERDALVVVVQLGISIEPGKIRA